MRSCVAVTGVAAISRDSESSSRNKDPDGTERDRRARAVATSRIDDPREFEWVRLDSANCEISKFVSCGGPVATTVRNNHRRCCRTSTSSGYSSHSPPLSAGSYSYYASATSALTTTSTSTRDPYSGLTVIHESETIPRPVWPSPVIYHCIEDRSADYKGIYTCRLCGCTYSCPLPSPPVSPSPTASARETLLQLSRTLNSVINGDIAMTPEDILRDISRVISLGKDDTGIYEYVYPWTLDVDGNLSASSYVRNVPSRVNPVNCRLYGGPRCLYGHNSARSVSLLVKDERTRREENGEAGRWTRENNSEVTSRSYETPCPYICKYLNGSHNSNNDTKLSFRLEDDSERRRNELTSTGSKYSAQTKCGDVDSSSEGTIVSSSANWNRRLTVKSSIGEFDFTLDVTRAELLGRAIARAKRKRRWCRVLTVFFGLVFFILSVVVVSLSVTRGRKAFGSM